MGRACVGLVMILGGVTGGCGGGGARPDAGDGSIAPGDGACVPSTDAAEPQLPSVVTVDGGIPIDQLTHAYAIARCNYYGRCSSLAAYIVDECIQAWTQGEQWTAATCARTDVGQICSFGTIIYNSPSPALMQALAAGQIGYDPVQMAACLQALSTQACHGRGPWESIPACNQAFSCPSGAGADAGADGGAGCTDLVPQLAYTLTPCSGPSDCPGAGPVSGPYCVDGYCTPMPCGLSSFGCESVGDGQPCDSDPPFLDSSIDATPWGTMPTALCARGRTCKGLTGADALGACAPPADIGEACAEGAAITGCRIGLVCQCGACRMPPTQGSCVEDTCKTGVAYCDFNAGHCVPVGAPGDRCFGAQSCAPNLTCGASLTCTTGG